VRGALWPDDERSVSVVGTRVPSAYGRGTADSFSHDLAVAGVTVVSGLARGVDGIVHRAALDAGKSTIAVMGSGVNVIYPGEHANLAERIVENGALVSEHPLGAKPDARNFPRRNRIMVGMTLGTLVIEGSLKSGVLLQPDRHWQKIEKSLRCRVIFRALTVRVPTG
jgi:DNA processing protein